MFDSSKEEYEEEVTNKIISKRIRLLMNIDYQIIFSE